MGCGVTGAVGGVASVSGTTLIEIFLSTNKARQTLCNFKYFLTLSRRGRCGACDASAPQSKSLCATPSLSSPSSPHPRTNNFGLKDKAAVAEMPEMAQMENGKW